jgi:hypothetical protein
MTVTIGGRFHGGAGTLSRSRRHFGLGKTPAQLPFNGLPQVLQQVKAVRYLSRLRCTSARPLCIETTPVSTHDFNLGVLLKPFRSHVSGALPQYVYNLSPLQVNDNRSVAPALMPTPIINAGHPQCGLIPNGGATLHDPDDCVVTLRDAKAMQ